MDNLKKVPTNTEDLSKETSAAPAMVSAPSSVQDIGVAVQVAPKKDEYTLEVIKDYDGKIDPFYLSAKDPDYEYRFLRDDRKNLSMKTSNMLFQKGGWQIVPREHLPKIGIKDAFISPDGLYRVGDTILARIPKSLFLEKQKQKEANAQAPMDAIKRVEKEGDPSEGGVDIHRSMKGIQTQEKLRM